MSYPSDPVCHPDECWSDDLEGSIGTGHRVAVHRSFADEHGYHFTEVSCTRAYINIFTRQEIWDETVEDRIERELMNRGIDYDYERDRYYFADDPTKFVDRAYVESLSGPTEVPWDWEPDWDGDVHGWEFVDRSHQRAIPVWHCAVF